MYDDNRKKWEVFKEKKTLKNLHDLIWEHNYGEDLDDPETWSSETAEMMEDLRELKGRWDTVEAFSAELWHTAFAKYCDIHTLFHCVETGLHPRIKFLRDELLPFIRDELVKAGYVETHDATELRQQGTEETHSV
jgi:hypothetical protein